VSTTSQQRMKKYIWPVIAIAWVVFLTLPISFFITKGGPQSDRDWLNGLYVTFAELFGERAGRWSFCGLWLLLNVALLWRFLFHRQPPGDPVDLDD
jgi:hypothetical protein